MHCNLQYQRENHLLQLPHIPQTSMLAMQAFNQESTHETTDTEILRSEETSDKK